MQTAEHRRAARIPTPRTGAPTPAPGNVEGAALALAMATLTALGCSGSDDVAGDGDGGDGGAGYYSVSSSTIGVVTGAGIGGAGGTPANGAGGHPPGPTTTGNGGAPSASTGPSPAPCATHDGDVGACDADPQDCAYYLCTQTCWPEGTPLDIACASPSGSGSGGACSFAAPNGCGSAEEIPAIVGDEASNVRVYADITSKWFEVYVQEVSAGVNALKYTATLQSPPGASYGLYVYQGGGITTDCNAVPSVGSGEPRVVSREVGDTLAADQSHWVTIEVRHLGGNVCTDPWLLTLQGNFAIHCQDDGACTAADDCICDDCAQDAWCGSPASCADDGVCDPYNEGCLCADCSTVPACG